MRAAVVVPVCFGLTGLLALYVTNTVPLPWPFNGSGVSRTERLASSLAASSEDPAPGFPAAPGDAKPAQRTEMAPPAPPKVMGTQGEVTPAEVVDDTALRHFARIGDKRRLDIEVARLRALHPGWTPPTDFSEPVNRPDAELQRMWSLFSDGRYAELRQAIGARTEAQPGWTAPADLVARLSLAESRDRLVNASDLKQYDAVVRVAAETPALLTCDDVDVLWRVAEAFVRTDRAERARDGYLYVLSNCTDPPIRLSTVQKAAQLLPRSDIAPLLELEKVGAGGPGEFASVRDDIARRAIAEAGDDPALHASADDIARVEAAAETGAAADALLLGWYHLRRDGAVAAEPWFRRAREKEDSAEAAQGLGLALADLGRPAEAEAALYPWRGASDQSRDAWLGAAADLVSADPPAQIDTAVLARIVTGAAEQHDAVLGRQLGWYALALGQTATAAQWFVTALGWKADDEPAAFGLAIARQRLGDVAGLAQVQAAWVGRSDRIAAVGTPVAAIGEAAPAGTSMALAPAAPAAAEAAPSETPTSPSTPRAAIRSTTTCGDGQGGGAGAVNRGWCLLEVNRPLEAATAFGEAVRSSAPTERADAAYGQSLAYLRLGLTDNAALAATKAPLSAARVRELQSQILAQRAAAAFEARRFTETLITLDQRAAIAPEQNDLMTLRGFAYLKLRRFEEARRVFEAVAATGHRDALGGLAEVERAMFPKRFKSPP